MMSNKERYTYLDFLRVIASVFIIIIHVTSVGLRESQLYSFDYNVNLILNSISRWALPMFFMISGALFLNPNKNIDKTYLIRKIKRIVLCIIFWGFFYSILDQMIYSSLTIKSIPIAIYGIITNHTGYHLWFLYTLLMLYIGVPIFRIITKNSSKKQLQYILLVWIIVNVFLQSINEVASIRFNIEELFSFESYSIYGYSGWFLLGYYLFEYNFEKKYNNLITLSGIVSVVLLSLMNLTFVNNSGVDPLLSNTNIFNFLICVMIFILVKKYNDRIDKYSEKVYLLGNLSFGAYLIHPFFITFINQVLGFSFFELSIIRIPFIIVGISILSCLFAWLIKKTPFKKVA